MEGDAESPRDLPRAQEKRGRRLWRGSELALERDQAVGVGTGDAEIEVEVARLSRLLHDLVELVVAVEGEAPHPKVAIGAGDRAARLDRVHEEKLGVLDRREPLDLDQRGDVEGADA